MKKLDRIHAEIASLRQEKERLALEREEEARLLTSVKAEVEQGQQSLAILRELSAAQPIAK